MENLHTIIESGQRQLEEERQGSEALRNDMLAMERQLASSTKSMEKLALALRESPRWRSPLQASRACCRGRCKRGAWLLACQVVRSRRGKMPSGMTKSPQKDSV